MIDAAKAAQIRVAIEEGRPRTPGMYDPSADGKAYLFYPCDDHVVRVRKKPDGSWFATLTAMRDRRKILHQGTGATRASAVTACITLAANGAK